MFRGRWRLEVPRKWGGFFRNDAEHRDFTAIGTAAGPPLAQAPIPCITLRRPCYACMHVLAGAPGMFGGSVLYL